MTVARDLRIILSNLKGLFLTIGVIMLFMAVLCVLTGEMGSATGFLYGAIIGIFLWVLLKAIFPATFNPELRHAMIVAALAYLIVPAIGMIPFVTIQHMAPLDAFFESISGWTTSGFSMIPDPAHSDHMVILWRSLIQWIGGMGVILLMVTILIRPGTGAYVLYQSEARKEKIYPSIRSTLNSIWSLYLVLTIAGTLLLIIAGMPAWDAFNQAMSGISSGGFSLKENSIADYGSVWIELAVIPIMIAGALPFVVLYKAFRKDIRQFFNDIQVRTFLLIMAVGAGLLILENYFFYHDLLASVRYSVFQYVSAATTTGFQTVDVSRWSSSALLIMSIGMIIGGCAGSSAGGIKVARVYFLNNNVKLWFEKTLRSKNTIVTLNIGNKRVTEDIVNNEMAEATLISFLWIVTISMSVLLLSHIVGQAFDLSHIIFAVCSAQSNVGITCGIVNPALPYIGKIIIMIDMWIGRLEIIPVMLLLRFLFKGFKS
jgi:trk system potassium uptake protein TrkH